MFKLEINEKVIQKYDQEQNKNILIGLPASMDGALFRIKLYEDQALIAFPKFTTLGISFQKEENDWNCNLPYVCDENKIYEHIKCNKYYKEIKKKDCIEAIKILKIACQVFITTHVIK